MSFDMRELYQETILNHSKHPRNFGKLDSASSSAEGNNPFCGDQVQVFLQVEGKRITNISFEGCGCAISVASASLMTEALKGKSLAEAESLFKKFQSMVTEGGVLEDLGELQVFEGVREHPVRIKCAIMPWHAFKEALGA